MSRYLCDTSALVAAVSSWHEHHDRTCAEMERRKRGKEELVISAHSLAETYAVLTRLPAPHRLRATDAIALIESNWRATPTVQLTGAEMWSALREAQRRAAAHDAPGFGDARAVFGDEHAGDAVVRADAREVALHDFCARRAAGANRRVQILDACFFE